MTYEQVRIRMSKTVRPDLPPGLSKVLRTTPGTIAIVGVEYPAESNQYGAIFFEDRRYRYDLWRVWTPEKAAIFFVCLNPSTANETTNDPTVRRCIGFAKQWGYGGMHMLNLFGLVSTDPRALEAPDSIGPENDRYLRGIPGDCVVAWGNEGSRVGRSTAVREIIKSARCFGLTLRGEPKHPLYLPKDAPLCHWRYLVKG